MNQKPDTIINILGIILIAALPLALIIAFSQAVVGKGAAVEVERSLPVVEDERLWDLYDECHDEWKRCDFEDHRTIISGCSRKFDACVELLTTMQGNHY